jgi:membrane protein DedA with SNARE-associated domain/uncharacterized membrane protein
VIRVSVEVDVDLPAPEVFAYLEDAENNTEWLKNMRYCKWTTPPPIRAGSRYDQMSEFLGREIRTSFEVTDQQPGRSITITSCEGSSFPIKVTRMVEARGDANRHVTELVEGDPSGFYAVASPLLRRLVRRTIEQDYRKHHTREERSGRPLRGRSAGTRAGSLCLRFQRRFRQKAHAGWMAQPDLAVAVQRPRLGRKRVAGIAGAVVVVIGVIVFAVLEGDVPDVVGDIAGPFAMILRRFGHLAPIPLLYIEESGVPLPLPGDVFVMYVAHHLPRTPLALGGAWLALEAAVVLGATNLFWLSRRIGTGLPEHRIGKFLHVTPERIQKAGRWFDRYGAAALIFGRHIPGFRVPLTVAAGVARVPYRTFIFSVAISTAAWVAIFLYLGVTFGGRISHLLAVHRQTTYLVVASVVVVAVAVFAFLHRRQGQVRKHVPS